MKKPVPFGKYLLLERINVGGMAEVFKAKAFGVEGFERLVAVKRILPSIAEDQEFIDMFIDEAKIAVQLTHANIAQIFDLGKVLDSYFIAMEFVGGKDLRTIFDRSKKKNEPLPVPMVCYAVMKVCEGLDYAHNKRDSSGREMHVVHRDVSPQNLLVSYDGEVKVIDFGIAKAANKMGRTQAGILKGKFGYMSPEQVRGQNLDRRSDVFAMGIVLYELLTLERLFVGESDFSTLEKVRHVDILPPTSFNNKIPPELERIVLRALAKDTQERYQTAMDLHDDLQAFMYATGNFFARKDLSAYMRRTFAEEIAKETARDEQYRSLEMPAASAEPPPLRKSGTGVKASAGVSGVAVAPPAATAKAAAPPAQGPVNMEWDDEELATQIYDRPDIDPPAYVPPPRTSSPRVSVPGAPPPAGPPRLPPPGGAGRTLPGGNVAPPPAPRQSNPRVSAPPLPPPSSGRSGASLPPPPPPDVTDVVPTPMASPRSEMSREPTAVTPRPQQERSMMPMAIAGLVLVGLLAGAAFFFLGPKDPGTIHLETEPPDTVVVFDGEVVRGSSSPFVITDVEANTPHLIEVRKPGFEPWHQQITVRPGQAFMLPKITLRSRESGAPRSVDVTFTSEPEGATVFLVRGRERRHVGPTPVTFTVALSGDPWTVEMTSTGFEPWRGPLAVPAGQTSVTLAATLRQADPRANDRLAQAVAATDRLNQNEASARPAPTPAWAQTAATPAPTPTVTMTPTTAADTTSMAVAPPPQPVTGTGPGTLRINSIPWSQVYVDGRLVGNTPQMNVSLAPGPHRITLVNTEVNVREVHTIHIEPGETLTRVIRLNVPAAATPTP